MYYTVVAPCLVGKYGDVMSNKPRSVTRATVANPIYWLAIAAFTAGLLMGNSAPWWSIVLAAVGIAAVTNGIERWYVTARAKIIVTQGIVDAAAIRPELFHVCPKHGDGCDAACRSRQSARRS